jgi:hypothetical protein
MTNNETSRAVKAAKCATLGCKNPATHTISYTSPGYRDQPLTDKVCLSCGESYTRRPALQATLSEKVR